LLCFAATSVAAVYHLGFGWKAPYGYLSLPVVLGTTGGVGLAIGPAGLLWLRRARDPAIADPAQHDLDVSFIVLLLLTSVTGLLLLVFRETAAMASLLVVHLGVVLALFVTLPYGKFVHGIYRSAALLKYALERQRAER
jgi:citrate/tricarballylate utilization protein